MPAIKIRDHLDFVDGDETRCDLARHRLDRGNPETWVFRLDLFLAGDERNLFLADFRDNALVYLARQQPERQADHPGIMTEHPLDR